MHDQISRILRGLTASIATALLLLALAACSTSEEPLTSGQKPDTTTGADVSREPVCQAGQGYCNGTTLWTCKPDRTGYEQKSCPGGCTGGQCSTKACTKGTKECQSDKTLRTCKDDESGFDVKTCPDVCEKGACVTKTQCEANKKECQGKKLRSCKADGTGFTTEDCPFGCDAKALKCMAAACKAGETRCSTESGKEKVLEKCKLDRTAWEVKETCKDLCKSGACVTQTCSPGTSFCDGNTVKKCNADGTAATKEDTCEIGCSVPSPQVGAVCDKCKKNSVACIDLKTIGRCNDPSSGMESIGGCADPQRCANGTCVSVLSWTAGDTNEDAYVWFTIHAASCWLDGQGDGQGRTCWALDTMDLPQSFDEGAVENWFCDGKGKSITADTLVGTDKYSGQELLDAADDLYGCGVFNLNDIDFKATGGKLEKGKPLGFYCMTYDTYLGDEVFIIECGNGN